MLASSPVCVGMEWEAPVLAARYVRPRMLPTGVLVAPSARAADEAAAAVRHFDHRSFN